MLYVDFTAGNEQYKLRLNTRNIIALEKQLGCNPLAIFGKGDIVPTVTVMVNILHSSLQAYQHNITLDKAYDIFDAWLADGNAMTDFIAVIVEVYQTSGLFNNKEEAEAKN